MIILLVVDQAQKMKEVVKMEEAQKTSSQRLQIIVSAQSNKMAS